MQLPRLNVRTTDYSWSQDSGLQRGSATTEGVSQYTGPRTQGPPQSAIPINSAHWEKIASAWPDCMSSYLIVKICRAFVF